jgi:hypothetical protein
VILEDDESDIPEPEPEAAAVSALVDAGAELPSELSKGPWYDVEDECYVDDDLCPIPPLAEEGLASTPTLAHGQPYSYHHPPGSSQDQINQHGNDGTTGGASDEPAHTLPALLDEDGGRGSHENASKLERDLLPAFGEQKKSSSAPAPSSPRPHCDSVEPPLPQIDREHDQSGTSYGRLEELGHGSPLRSQDQEEPQEQQQQGVVVEAVRADDYDDDGERGQRGEKRPHQDEAEEISSDNCHPKDSDCSHDTGDEDDDPRPAKRRKLPPAPTDKALTPPLAYNSEAGPKQRHNLTTPSTTQLELDDTQSRVDRGSLPTPVDSEQHHMPRPSRSPSESLPVAEYQEWPFQGFLKRAKIGNETTYNLEFRLPRIPEHLHLPVLSEALGMRSHKETSAEAATPHNTVAHSKVQTATLQSKRKRVPWQPEENETILKMKEEGRSWEEIHAALPHRTPGAIQVQYSTKLKK